MALIKILDNSQQYLFTSKGELVLTMKSDGGLAYFK
jgi:hypothetical protein